jgi:hypothetical protein
MAVCSIVYAVCLPGGVRHCHRKLHAFEHRRIVSGDRFTVFDTAWGVRVGVLIGGDAYLVENVRMTALMGATLLVAPHRSYSAQRGGGRVLQPVSAEQWRNREAKAGAPGTPLTPGASRAAGSAVADGARRYGRSGRRAGHGAMRRIGYVPGYPRGQRTTASSPSSAMGLDLRSKRRSARSRDDRRSMRRHSGREHPR